MWYPVQRFQSETGPWPRWGRVSPSNAAVVPGGTQGFVSGDCGRAVLFPKSAVFPDRNDRGSLSGDNGGVAAAGVVGTVCGHGAKLFAFGDLAQQVRQ